MVVKFFFKFLPQTLSLVGVSFHSLPDLVTVSSSVPESRVFESSDAIVQSISKGARVSTLSKFTTEFQISRRRAVDLADDRELGSGGRRARGVREQQHLGRHVVPLARTARVTHRDLVRVPACWNGRERLVS